MEVTKQHLEIIPGHKGRVVVVTKVKMSHELTDIFTRLQESGFRPFLQERYGSGNYVVCRPALVDDPRVITDAPDDLYNAEADRKRHSDLEKQARRERKARATQAK